MYFDDQYMCDCCGAVRRGMPAFCGGDSLPPPGWCASSLAPLWDGPHSCSHECWEVLGMARARHMCAGPCPWCLPPPFPPYRGSQRGYVYFIQAGDDGPIKVGYSTDICGRLSGLQTSNHERLSLIACFAGNREAEAAAHGALAAHRLRGEWYLPVAEVYRYAMQRQPWPEAI